MYVKKLRPILTRRKLEQLLLAASKARFFLNRCFDFWKKKRNRPKKKKIDRPHIELVSRQNKLESGRFSALFGCANEATARELCHYINNKTSGKYHDSVTSLFSKTKVSFVFRSTKDLRKIPLENWRYFSKTKCKSTKTTTQQCPPCQNKSVRQKSARSCKSKNRPKMLYMPFLQERLQLLDQLTSHFIESGLQVFHTCSDLIVWILARPKCFVLWRQT